MTDIPIWPGSSSFTTGSTPFGFYDSESSFQADADNVADWCARRLGYPLMDVELQASNFYACFEEAVMEYSNHVDQYNAQNDVHSLLPDPDGRIQYANINSVGRQWVFKYTLALAKENLGYIRGKYGSIPIPNGETTLNAADLLSAATTEKQALIEELKRIVDIMIRSKLLMTNFPIWPGSSSFTTGSTPFGYYDSDTDFQRDADDVADWCAKELGYPMQKVEMQATTFYALFENSVMEYSNYVDQYNVENNIYDLIDNSGSRIQYTDINTVGRQWIFKYTLASTKEKLGYIRGKYGSMPIGLAEASLNSADLISAGTTEKQALMEELKRLVDIMIRSKILMKNFPNWPGSSSFTTGSTPFGYYDNDTDFQKDADDVADWCARELGYPIQSVEIQASTFYALFENSVLEYSNYVDQYNVENNIYDLTDNSGSRIQYTDINSVGRQWIFKYTLANAKEKLGYIRGKYGSMPIGAAEATLNSADLLSAGTAEKQALMEELKRLVDTMIRSKILMKNFPSWTGSSTFTTGSTPFGYYDNDTDFQRDADDVADWCARELGYPMQSVEINDSTFYALFEQSVMEYSNYVDQYNVENDIHELIDNSGSRIQYTDINSVGRQWIFKYTLASAKEKLGYIRGKYGSMPIGSAEATLNSADLLSAATTEKQTLMEELKRLVDLMIRSKLLMKNFPKWPGSSTFTTGSTPFGYYDNDTDFQKDADDVADWCAKELGYPMQSVELQASTFYALFENAVMEYSNYVDQYSVENNIYDLIDNSGSRIQYTDINSVGRQWIFKYTLALSKEKLGYIRGKYGSMPIGSAEATLNASDLLSAAATEKQALIEDLKRLVDTMIRSKILMTKFPIWPGSSSFTTGSTPFGTFDDDIQFQSDADAFADWCAKRLGYPMVSVELKDVNFYTCFEEAIYEYSYHVNQFNIQQNLLSIIGASTGSNLTQRNVSSGMGPLIQLATEYGSETFTNGNISFYSSSIDIEIGKQKYNLDTLIRDIKVPTGSIEIKRVHHYALPASMRFYDPYLGNQAMLDTFGFGAYSTGVSFMLMPMYADLLRVQAIEFNDMMRKSSYTFELINNELRIFPVPTKNYKLWIEYIVKEERSNPLKYPDGTVSDMSNAPYDYMVYSKINSVGKNWIYSFGLALAKEMLGYIRGKYGSMPIGNAEATLNSADLISAAGAEKQALVDQLRTILDTMTRAKLLEAKRMETEALSVSLNGTPLAVFIG